MAGYEYKTEILTSMVGREKLRLDELDDTLKKYGDEGWELVSLALDAEALDARLRPGLSARVEVIADRHPDALLVPREALSLGEGEPQVILAGGARHAVTLGPCNAEVCVAAGLEAGAKLRRAR